MMDNKQQEIVNNNKRDYLDPMSKHHFNPNVALHVSDKPNHKKHEMMKASVAYDLMAEGRVVYSEAILLNGGRPDLLVMDTLIPYAYEIVMSEKEESIMKKRERYGEIKIIVVKAE